MTTEKVLLAVNGTLIRELEFTQNMVTADAEFVREGMTEPAYRLWSIDDVHPAMVGVNEGGAIYRFKTVGDAP